MKKEGIKVAGHTGTWYVIDEGFYLGRKIFLLEHEQYGDDAAALIIDQDGYIIMDDVYNGFSDLI